MSGALNITRCTLGSTVKPVPQYRKIRALTTRTQLYRPRRRPEARATRDPRTAPRVTRPVAASRAGGRPRPARPDRTTDADPTQRGGTPAPGAGGRPSRARDVCTRDAAAPRRPPRPRPAAAGVPRGPRRRTSRDRRPRSAGGRGPTPNGADEPPGRHPPGAHLHAAARPCPWPGRPKSTSTPPRVPGARAVAPLKCAARPRRRQRYGPRSRLAILLEPPHPPNRQIESESPSHASPRVIVSFSAPGSSRCRYRHPCHDHPHINTRRYRYNAQPRQEFG